MTPKWLPNGPNWHIQSICLICNEINKDVQYIGESSRSIYERGADHLRDCRSSKKKSHIRYHMLMYHPGAEDFRNNFCIHNICNAKMSFLRGIVEYILQRNFKGDQLLNSKQEYNSRIIPTLEAPSVREKEKTLQDWYPLNQADRTIWHPIYRIRCSECREAPAEV